MKKILSIILITISLMSTLHASELVSIESLKRLGLQLKMGELTGAGSKFKVQNLAGLVLPEGVLLKEHCTGIVVKNVEDPNISDIVKIKVGDQEIMASEFTGFVVK